MALSRTGKTIGIVVISIPMLLYGASSFDTGGVDESAAIQVGDQTISATQLELQVARQIDGFARQAGINPGEITDVTRQAITNQVIDDFVRSLVLAQVAADARLQAVDGEVTAEVRQQPAFFVDGKFSPERFQAVTTNQQRYIADVRKRLSIERVSDPFVNGALATPEVLAAISSFQGERRVIRVLDFPVDITQDFGKDEDDALEIYANNPFEFTVPERIKIEYVHVDAASVAGRVVVDDAALEQAHARRTANAVANEERQLAMILLETSEQAEQAQAALDGGADFASVAAEYSLDEGSKAVGGDIGFVSRDDLPAEVADAVFAAAVGDILGPFDSDGFLIFKVTGKIGGSVTDFAEVRDELAEQVAAELAELEVNEVATLLEEQLANTTTADLTSVLAPLGLTSSTTDWIELDSSVALPAPLDDAVLAADILDASLRTEQGKFSGLLRREDNTYLVVRVADYEAEHKKDFAEVKDEIIAELNKGEAVTATAKAINQFVLDVSAGQDVPQVDFDSVEPLEVDQLATSEELEEIGITQTQLETIFYGTLLPSPQGLPAYHLSFNPETNVFKMFRVDEIIPAESSNSEVATLFAQLIARTDANAMLYGYIEELYAGVEINVEIPANLQFNVDAEVAN